MKALGDEDWRVRKEATSVATAMAPSPAVLSGLVDALGPGENVGLRNAAVEALAGYGKNAVHALSRALGSLDADGRKLAAEALGGSGHSSALVVLKTMLGDPDVNVRAAVTEAIAQSGTTCLDDAVPLLQRCLEADDSFQRLTALDGLNRLGVVLAWERIEPMLDDPVLEHSAWLAAGRSGDERAAPVLARALERARGSGWYDTVSALVDLLGADVDLRGTVRSALANLSPQVRERLLEEASATQGDALDARRTALVLVGMLDGDAAVELAVDALVDDRVAAEGEQALSLLGARAVPLLIRRATDSRVPERGVFIEMLGRLADAGTRAQAVRAIRAALSDESFDVAGAALTALAMIGDESCVRPVADWLAREGAPARVRQAAASALSELARRFPAVAQSLARGATPESPDAHSAAVILAALGEPVRDTLADDVGFLSSVLSSDSSAARRAALDALAALGSALGVEAVAFALTDEELEVQLAAVHALGRLRDESGGAAGVEHLLELVRAAEDQALVAAAISALGEAGDARAVSVLRPLARSGDPMSAVAAVEALGRLHDQRRVDALIDALSHPEAEVVKAALRVLTDERDARVGAHLGACLDHEAWDVRRLAADLLGRLGGEPGMRLLRAKLAGEDEPLVKEAIQRALSKLEGVVPIRRTTPPPGRVR
jgi:HEAT repeat protein